MYFNVILIKYLSKMRKNAKKLNCFAFLQLLDNLIQEERLEIQSGKYSTVNNCMNKHCNHRKFGQSFNLLNRQSALCMNYTSVVLADLGPISKLTLRWKKTVITI